MWTLPPLELIQSFAWWRILAYAVSAVCLVGTMMATFTIPLETTPHVYQASGYVDIDKNKSIWFVSRFDSASTSTFRFRIFITNIPSTGSGFSPRATILTPRP
jgi:hypothetical protein